MMGDVAAEPEDASREAPHPSGSKVKNLPSSVEAPLKQGSGAFGARMSVFEAKVG
jgi:hypothetical protein